MQYIDKSAGGGLPHIPTATTRSSIAKLLSPQTVEMWTTPFYTNKRTFLLSYL